MKEKYKFGKIAQELIEKLESAGINAYIWHKATTGSVYIRFEDNRIGSIRLGNHNGIDKYKYKFNIRSDIKFHAEGWRKENDVWRYYIHAEHWRAIIPVLIRRKNQVKNWDSNKYQYGIPSYKKS